jgi:glycosyltransferase involved in cell wall biosynthesis
MTGVSVIVPCHNSGKTIALCIEAALAQTHPDVEVVVVDDASTDDTPRIAARYPVRTVRLDRNGGAGIARNRGMSAAHGDIFFFVDSDVALAPDAVANAVRAFAADPALGAVWGVYGDRPLVDDGVVERVQVLHGHFRQISARSVHTGHFAIGAVHRRVVDAIGGFDERLFGQWTNEDHEFGLRIARHFPIARGLDVVGYHDDDDRLSSVVHKRFGRAVSLMPLVFGRRDLKPEREALHRPAEILAALLTLGAAVLTPLTWAAAVAALAALAWFVVGNRPLLAFVRRRAGLRLAIATGFLIFLYAVAVGAGALTGALRFAVDGRFRRRYRPAPLPGSPVSAG